MGKNHTLILDIEKIGKMSKFAVYHLQYCMSICMHFIWILNFLILFTNQN